MRLAARVGALSLVLAVSLTACSSTSSTGPASDGLDAIRAGSASSEQVIQVLQASTATSTSARVTMEQLFEMDSEVVSPEAEALLDFRISTEGVVTLDGSAGEMTMKVNSPGSPEIRIQYLDGRVWVTNPVTGDWEENAEMAAMLKSVSAASASQFLLPGQSVEFVGPDSVNGVEAYEYRTEVTVTAEYLEQLAGLGLVAGGSDMLIGETVTASVWITDNGLPVRSEVRTSMDKALASMGAGGLEGATGVYLVQRTSWSDFGSVQAPSAPPVQKG